jgi:hypothetical protein
VKKADAKKQVKPFPLGGSPVLMPVNSQSRAVVVLSARPQTMPINQSVVGWSIDVRHSLLVQDGQLWRLINGNGVDSHNRLIMADLDTVVSLPIEKDLATKGNLTSATAVVSASAPQQRRLAVYLNKVLTDTLAKLTPEAIAKAVSEAQVDG